MLGGRPLSRVLKEAVRPRNYVALARMVRVCDQPLDVARRYFLGGGHYPYECDVRTPLGVVRPMLYSHHDVWTLVEIFCREDYRASRSTKVVVDVGANIGISALYFLTRNPACRCHLYEPDPRNIARLRANLAQHDGRWRLHEAAVGPEAGPVDFGREPTGRYGAVGARTLDVIRVPCLSINAVVEQVLAEEPKIDVLKVDTEGLEESTVAAIEPRLLERIEAIYFESERPAKLHADRFDYSFANETVHLQRREAGGLTDS